MATVRRPPSRQSVLHVVALGASAGGLQAVRDLVAGLGDDFPAAVLVVIHTSPEVPCRRAELLARHTNLRARMAREGDALAAGHVYVAAPDHHLLVEGGRLLVRRGPIENNVRPAVDPLFRSAAASFGPRAIGVVLSGFESQDGVSGLKAIKRCGGFSIVQDPDDAEFDGMPDQAIALDSPDRVLRIAEMPAVVRRRIAEPKPPMPEVPPEIVLEVRIAAHDQGVVTPPAPLGQPSLLTCPECGGALREIEDGTTVRYRCHVGHAYSAGDLSSSQLSEVDRALAAALRAINERIALLQRLVQQAHRSNRTYAVRSWEERITEYEGHASAIRKLLLTPPADQVTSPAASD